MPPLVHAKAIRKRFGAVQALDDVDFELRPGEIHALLGENGAGKSTLLNVLAGVHRHDSGQLEIDGRPRRFTSPRDAQAAGIAMIHQELRLVPELSVAENFWLGRLPTKSFLGTPLRRIDRKRMERRATQRLQELGSTIDVRRPAGELGAAHGQLLTIARALDQNARVLLMDEPTSSLDDAEVQRLFAVLRELARQGIGIVFVSHFLERVRAIAHRVTILRDGQRVATEDARGLTRADITQLMLGEDFGTARPMLRANVLPQRKLLRARIAGDAALAQPYMLELSEGEVCGLAGLLGSRRTELARAVFGTFPGERVELEIDGARRPLRSPREAIALGFAYCPEERRRDGLFTGLDLVSNLSLLGGGFWVSRRRMRERAQRAADRLSLRHASLRQQAGQLSGGNQQKLVLGRWLSLEPRVYVLDEPTRGIDVGARAEIENWIAEEAGRGAAVLFIASELDELARRCGRVLVLVDGVVTAELRGDQIEERSLVAAIGRGQS